MAAYTLKKANMEDWEVILESYPMAPDVRVFTKALRTAELALKGDLAPFESEWIINTLCFKPVNLFETVSSNCQDTPWSKPVCDAFKLLGYVVEKFPAEHLYENIVTLCLLPYTPQIRKDALQCLTKLARLSQEAARDWSRLVSELGEAATGKAPLAVLVGTLAEYHPELVTSDVNRVWRIYLNLLGSNKNTDTVITSVLQGLCGLFKHFGQDLPIMEFRDLYTKLSKEYVRKTRCEKASLCMLESYSDLFKELLSDDRPLRDYLWSLQHTAAITSVYKALATAVTLQKLQTIVDTELLPRVKSRNSDQRHTALRIVKLLASVHNISGHTDGFANVQVLEHELRSGNVAFETVDAILWCIESNALYSDKLLQTAILYFNNIPSSKRTPIVVHGLLNAPEDVRTAATTLLITESCQLTKDTHNIEHYLPLWKDLLDSKGGKDTVVLERAKYVFADVMEYLFTVLEAVLDEEHETLPEKLSPLLTLTYHVLTFHLPEQYTERPCNKLLRLLRGAMSCGISAPLISAVVAASKHCWGDLAEYCKLVRVDKCLDEAVLCEACHMLVQADGGEIDVANVLQALEILFSRKNVEPTILSAALLRFETIMNEHDDLERERVDYIVHLVDNLRSLKDTSSKEARILHRDVIIFLGKYGNDKYIVEKSKENTVIAKLKDKLLLNLPNTEEGITYKLNVQRILHLAVVYEDSDALQKLLAIMCVTLSSKADSDLQLALTTVIRSLCRSHAHSSSVDVAAVQHAVLLCRTVDCVGALLTAISSEKSPGARKMLSDALEGLLLVEPGSEDTELLIRAVADEAAAMMRSGDPTSRSGGLNITETLITALKDNHALQKSILPDLLTLILETDDLDAKNTFQNASQLLLDNLQIYENDVIKDINLKLVENVLKSKMFKTDVDVKLFKDKVKETACFIIDVKQFENEQVCVERLSDDFERVLCFMAEYKMAFTYDVFVVILEKIDGFRTENEGINAVFKVEAVLKFLEEYCDVLIEKNQEMSIKAVGNLFKNFSPNNILCLQKQIKSCATVYRKHIKPKALKEIYTNWCGKFSINDVISNVSVNDIHTENSSIVKAIVIYADLLDVIVDNDSVLQLCDTVLEIYVNNEEKYIDCDKEYLCDLLCLSLRFHTVESIKNFVRTTHEKSDMRFLKYFVEVFSKYFLKKPFLLLDEDLKSIAVIMKYVLKATLKKRFDDTYYARLLELLDKIWPVLSSLTSFEEKCEVLTLASRLPIQLPATSAPIQWAIEESTAGRDIGDKIRLVAVLPGGEECGASYRSLASHLPVRLSELSNYQHSALQALLDALATTGDSVVLDIVTKLADCDPTKGWWDEALASSMGSLARGDCLKHGSLNTLAKAEDNSASLMTIANSLFEIPSHGVCHRLLIPLLRYSSSSFCEQFYASTIIKLLAALNAWPRNESRASETQLLRILKEQARALALITLAFEKIPVPSLKSADSPLYAQVVDKQPSFMLRRACALCYQLRTKTIPEDASEELKMCYSQCLVENFKCFCGAVCISRPADNLYDCVYNPRVWEAIVCKDTVHTLPIHSEWNKRRTFHSIAVDIPSEARTGTLHTRMFLRTLSVDPLQYDLLQPPGQEDNALELELTINTLNCQECAAPLTSLVTHAASLARYQWRHTLCDALVGSYHRNLKWTIAQVIYNCKDSLSGHADALRPALLQMVADTACGDGKRTLNGLHVNALDIVLQWQDSPLPETSLPHLTSTIEYLINTNMDNAHRPSVFSSLLSLLGKLTELYGGKELPWNGFNEYLSVPSKLKPFLSILLIITKRKIRIPELLPALTQLNPTYWSQEQKLAELFGYALACESERGACLFQHRKFLARKTEGVVFVRNVFNTQKGYPRFVDEAIFKTITDMTPKLMRTERAHCLRILASYVEHASEVTGTISDMFETIDICSLLQDSSVDAMQLVKHGCRMMGDRLKRKVMSAVAGYCENSDPKVRKMAFEVALKVFEDLFKPKHSEPSAKKLKSNSSPILTAVESSDTSKVIECVARGVTDCVTSIASDVTEGVAACLNTSDMNIRLAESFLIALSIPATQKHQDLSVCVAAFLELLFKGMRSQPRFQHLKLREEPLEIREPTAGPLKLLTKSRTYHGTFLSTTRRLQKRKESTSAGINVQVAVDDILRTMADFAKHKPDAAQALCVQTIKCVLHRAGPGFDAEAALSRQICDVLSAPPSDVHPLAVELGRLLVDRVCGVPGFQNSLDKLRHLTKCTEGEPLVTLLYEDALLRSDDEIFTLGLQKYETTSMDVDSHATPTLEGIMSAFGKLSNWDRLTIQAKSEVMREGIPQLWVDGATFKSWLDGYEVNNTTTWFNKLVATCCDECKQDSLRWLRETDRWPRRHFHISAVAEAIQRSSDLGDDIKLPCDIGPSDCLAEWAARLMLGKAYSPSYQESSEEISLTYDQELLWCKVANDRQLPHLVINCVDVHSGGLDSTQILPWRIERARAMRSIGLDSGNSDILRETLSLLESSQIQVLDTYQDVIAMNKLILALHLDLGSMTKEKVTDTIDIIERNTDRQSINKNNKQALCSMYELAMTYYDDVWPEEVAKCELLSNMADVLARVIELDLSSRAEMLLSIILNRLDELQELDEDTAGNVLDKISLLVRNLDEFSLEAVRKHAGLFPARILAAYSQVIAATSRSDDEERYRRQLQLICDPRHSLQQRCAKLLHTNDPSEWKATFDLLKVNIFENPYAKNSTEYSLLTKYKDSLYQIEEFEDTERTQRVATLNKVLQDLQSRVTERATLRLSQLCPALTRLGDRDGCLARLLRLGRLGVVKIYEQVSVFTNAITRPVVIKVLITDGTVRHFITKGGESLRLDAAAQAAARAAAQVTGAEFQGYSVTPLGEDGGLIEYLEGTTTFRDLISSEHDLDAMAERLSRFIVSSSPMEKYRTYCNQIPAYTLRSAVENICSSVEDFIAKKQSFLETLSSLTLFGSLLGLGDRHLENFLYLPHNGNACCVDWASALQYGRGELPPARLTRNVLGLAHGEDVEARLQVILKSLRGARKLFLNVLKLSFKWMGPEFSDKFNYMKLFLLGEATTFDITEMSLATSDDRHRHKDSLKVLREIFAGESKKSYTVVEQISCLLKQCTHPRILSITREGWESHI